MLLSGDLTTPAAEAFDMGLKKAQDPWIDNDAPWENDDLHRQREGALLTKLISSLTGPYVVAIKGSWGTGKTIFLRRLSAHLEQAGVPVISFDAWRTDYLEDPLVAFVSATEARLAATNEQTRTSARNIAKGLANSVGKLSPPLAALVAEIATPGAGAAAGAATETTARVGQVVLDAIKVRRDAEEQFRAQLSKARDLLTNRDPLRPVQPIVVAIDELDRCRPSYAIKVLERIKHYFDVAGVVFLIATDGTNLPNAVSCVYGGQIDGELYLRKFFDYEFDLREPEPSDFVHVLADQFEFTALMAASPDKPRLDRIIETGDSPYGEAVSRFDRGLDALEIISCFPTFAKQLKLSLRDQAQAFTLMNAYIRTRDPKTMIYPSMLAFIYCLRFSDPALFQRIRAESVDLDMLFTRKLANTPPLIPDGDTWPVQSSQGWELSLFVQAAKDERPDHYLSQVRRQAHNASPQNQKLLRATNRIYYRLRFDRMGPAQFMPSLFTLADSLAQTSTGEA